MVAPKAHPESESLATLVSISQLLSSTATEQLPRVAPKVVAEISACSDLLSSSPAEKGGKSSEKTVSVHRFITQISTFLRDRIKEHQWTGIILVKSVVEIGGVRIFQRVDGWSKALLQILSNAAPSTIHILTILTLTRIFLLTQKQPTLIRELTTPLLPSFVTSCLNIIERSVKEFTPSKLISTILECFNRLLPFHPTIFRPSQSRIQQYLRNVIASTPGTKNQSPRNAVKSVSEEISEPARLLFVQLCRCAPKNGASEEWQKLLTATLESIQITADLVFRGMIELEPSIAKSKTSSNRVDIQVQQSGERDPLQLPGWVGIRAGCERLTGLLGLLKSIFENPTSSSVSCNFGLTYLLLIRLLSLRIPSPSDKRDGRNDLYNAEITNEERATLLAQLPCIHKTAIDLAEAMIARFGRLLSSEAPNVLILIATLLRTERYHTELRSSIYRLAKPLVVLVGPTIERSTVHALSGLFTECAGDCYGDSEDPSPRENKTNAPSEPKIPSFNQKAFEGQQASNDIPKSISTHVSQAAVSLLPALLSQIPANRMSLVMRTKLEQAAILIHDKDALVASVLNPGSSSSLLPFLVRQHPWNPETEAILRPRLPPVSMGLGGFDGVSETESEDTGAANIYDESTESEGEGEKNVPQVDMELANRKRKAENAEDAENTQPGASISSLKETVPAETFHDNEPSVPKTKPVKRVRFSDPESELLEDPQVKRTPEPVINESPQQLPSAPISMAIHESSANQDNVELFTIPRSQLLAEDQEDSDDDNFEIPPLTMEKDSDEE
ncbi:MAG: hypothetical protein M1820_000022 [Bogoriella megaspora]|nr:MAG: hypothetical protein M1820_000022 [Bogoriella megaspora]